MTKIIDALFFRLKKSVLFWVMLAVSFLLPLFTVSVSYAMLSILGDELGEMISINALLFVQDASTPYGDISLINIIVLSIFFGKEFTGGTMRNILLSAKSRAQMFFAFVIVGAIIAVSNTFANIAGSLLFGGTIVGFAEMTATEVFVNSVYLIAIAVMSTMTVMSILYLFLFSTRKLALTILLPIVICLFAPSIIIAIIEGISTAATISGTTLSTAAIEWLPLIQYYSLDGTTIDGPLALKILLMTVIVVGAFGSGAYFSFAKADLK